MTALSTQLRGKRVVVCAGAGGVGKTTVSAAVALGLAAQGRRVAAVTIDPARRLAEALGIDELGNEPQCVDAARFAAAGLHVRGELSAMMLDVKRTFDEVVERLSPDAGTSDAILRNPVYRHISTAVAGSQEYTAVAKLYELHRADDYDVIVLDTPPSRSAVEFLDAPDRLIGFLEGRALRAFLRPTGRTARAAGVMFSALRRITGVALLDDLTTFFQLFAQLLDGLRDRAAGVRDLLTDPLTAFLVVTSPERAAVAEALHLGRELDRLGMRRAGVIVNRVHPLEHGDSDIAAVDARLSGVLGARVAQKVARIHADVQVLARRDRAAIRELHAALHGPEPVRVHDRESDIRDAEGLVLLHRELFGDQA